MSNQSPDRPLAGHVGIPQTFAALGQTWTLARWTRGVWRDFLEWAKTQLPDPRTKAVEFLQMLPDTPENQTVRGDIVREALAASRAYLSPGSPEVLRLLDTMDGVCRVFVLLLRPAHPEITDDAAYEIVMAIGTDQAGSLLKGCAGVAGPPKDDGESRDSPPSPSSQNGSIGQPSTAASSGKLA